LFPSAHTEHYQVHLSETHYSKNVLTKQYSEISKHINIHHFLPARMKVYGTTSQIQNSLLKRKSISFSQSTLTYAVKFCSLLAIHAINAKGTPICHFTYILDFFLLQMVHAAACLYGLVGRVPGYRSRGSGSIPGPVRFSEKWVWNRAHSAS
jgi:hypothetical protein